MQANRLKSRLMMTVNNGGLRQAINNLPNNFILWIIRDKTVCVPSSYLLYKMRNRRPKFCMPTGHD